MCLCVFAIRRLVEQCAASVVVSHHSLAMPLQAPPSIESASTPLMAGAEPQRKALVYPRRFKTALCRSFMTNGACEYGSQCSFAHGYGELRRASSNQVDGQATPTFTFDGSASRFLQPDATQAFPSSKPRSASFNHPDLDKAAAARWGNNVFNSGKPAMTYDPFKQQQQAPSARSPSSNRALYHTELCRTFTTIGVCPYGDNCQFAHGMQQLRKKSSNVQVIVSRASGAAPAPTNSNSKEHLPRRSTFIRDRRTYKTELCRQFQQIGHCDYGNQCQFAHGIEELRAPTDPIVLPPDTNAPSQPTFAVGGALRGRCSPH